MEDTLVFVYAHITFFSFVVDYISVMLGLWSQNITKKEIRYREAAVEFRQAAFDSQRSIRRANKFFASLVSVSANRCDWKYPEIYASLSTGMFETPETLGKCHTEDMEAAHVRITNDFLGRFSEAMFREVMAHELAHAHDPECRRDVPFWKRWKRLPMKRLFYWRDKVEIYARKHEHDFDDVGTVEDWANLAYVLSMETGLFGSIDHLSNDHHRST